MKLLKILVFLLSLFSVTVCVKANVMEQSTDSSGDKTTQVFRQCIDRSGGATFAMHDCTYAEIEYQKKELTKLYQATLKQLPKNRQKVLQRAQSAWVAYYKVACEVYRDERAGQSAITNTDGCYLNLVVDRVEVMKSLHDAALNLK